MTRTARILVAVAALAMSAAYALPLWRVALVAPQYPEGLGMLIRVSTVDGFKEGDLQSINGLNHYIGMKAIEPDAIPELRFMPIILGVLIATGLGVAAFGRRLPFYVWSTALALVFLAGLGDYWKWGYEYGHDLSPTAIIKVPGMTYQPPLIGSKKLLNFTATSWPASGGWVLIGAAGLVAAALVSTVRARRRTPALVLSLALAGACAQGTRPIVLNEDHCEFCRMTISDARFGGEAITRTGKVYTFDSIECLARWANATPVGDARGLYVIDLQHPGTFIPAESAAFLTDVLIHAPMGRNIAAFATADAAEQQRAVLGGTVATWKDVAAAAAAAGGAAATGTAAGTSSGSAISAANNGAGSADLVVNPHGALRTLTGALAIARAGDRIVVEAGAYREPPIVVRTPRVTIEGKGWPVFDGSEEHGVLVIEADSVTVRGIVVRGTGVSQMEDRAGIRVTEARDCLIEGNRLRDNLFGIYLQRAVRCTVRDNDIQASGTSQNTSGNGIHLWQSPGALVERNRVSGHRDGIYFEFSIGGVTRDNVSEHNQRYGLHFMYSDSCLYERNVFRENTSGVAVMYSRDVALRGNTFDHAWGGGAYGLLLKEIIGGDVSENVFTRNSTALYLEGALRLTVNDNDFLQNGWGVRVLADAEGNRFTGNRFVGNAFDVTTNSRSATSTFEGNWWDNYRGYDLDRDGHGDAPFRPVRLFALVVEQHPGTLMLLRSPMVGVLDVAERVMPVLTPAALADAHPLMRSPR
jgi:nitrous oxidase accessory protein